MPTEVIMPKVDMDMSSGKIVTWHVAPGGKVEKGAPLFDIETDKAVMEVEAPATGILQHPVDPGADIPIGKTVAWLYAEGEAIGGDAPQRTLGLESAPIPAPAALGKPTTDRPVDKPAAQGIRATPLARQLAGEAGIDLRDLAGTGVRGRVQADDVRKALDVRSSPASIQPVADETGALSITRSGAGTGAPVVLLHGFASDSLSWTSLERELGERPIIRIDLPCHGKSPKRGIESFSVLVSEVRTAFDELRLERAHLVGHSLGGALAMALADTRARSMASLTLIAPAGLGPEIEGPVLDGICRASRPESLTPWLKTLFVDETLVTGNYAQTAMASRRDPTLRAAQQDLSEILFSDGVQTFDLRAALRRLDVATRIIWGKRDNIIPWRHALCAPGHVALHLFEGVGHLPQIETPEEVGKILRGYL
jgi:pyruvate dehydrogenase E2 component (dihydrolipoamide acetyltransferase)